MSNKVYSFTKVKKQWRKTGIYSLIFGVISLGVLISFIGYGIYKNGAMSGSYCLIPYITMIGSIVGFLLTRRDMSRVDVAGKFLYAGYRVCLVSMILHLLIWLIGILRVIM